MAELTPPDRNVSLDDLLKANKARFDRIFEVQMGESARLDSDRLPPSNGDLEVRADPSNETDGGGYRFRPQAPVGVTRSPRRGRGVREPRRPVRGHREIRNPVAASRVPPPPRYASAGGTAAAPGPRRASTPAAPPRPPPARSIRSPSI